MPMPTPEMWATRDTVYAGCPMRMRYATTNRSTTNPGNDWRTVLPLRQAPVSDTALGKAGDPCPGWWMQQGAAEKWFRHDRILEIKLIMVTEALGYADCPRDIRAMAATRDAQARRGASPDGHSRSRSRSRSHSRSRSRSASPPSQHF